MDPTVFVMVNIAICLVLNTLGFLAFGIANAVVSSQNTGAKGECGEAIWYCIMVLAVLDFLAFFGGTTSTIKRTSGDSDGEKNAINWVGLGSLGVSIWACVAYFQVEPECHAFYEHRYPHLWNMLLANVIFFFVSIGMGVWIIFCYCFAVCITGPRVIARTEFQSADRSYVSTTYSNSMFSGFPNHAGTFANGTRV